MPLPYIPSTIKSSIDLQCVGMMEIAATKPIGFLCSFIPFLAGKIVSNFQYSSLKSQETYVISPTFVFL